MTTGPNKGAQATYDHVKKARLRDADIATGVITDLGAVGIPTVDVLESVLIEYFKRQHRATNGERQAKAGGIYAETMATFVITQSDGLRPILEAFWK